VPVPEGVHRNREHAEVVIEDERFCESAAGPKRERAAVRERKQKEITRAREHRGNCDAMPARPVHVPLMRDPSIPAWEDVVDLVLPRRH
jgi:hypothetical protein